MNHKNSSSTSSATPTTATDDPFALAHAIAKATNPLNHLVVAATDQAYRLDHLQVERDRLLSDLNYTSVLADAIIKAASALIISHIPSSKSSAYWDAVTTFRRFEEKQEADHLNRHVRTTDGE